MNHKDRILDYGDRAVDYGNEAVQRPARAILVAEGPAGKKKESITQEEKEFRKKFTFPYWNLPEGKNAKKEANGGVVFTVNKVKIHLLPDRFASQEELEAENDTFKREDGSIASAHTQTRRVATHFDVNKIGRDSSGWMIVDYEEPTFEISIQVTYRETKKAPTLEKARKLLSAYGKGRTLEEHERWHVADSIDYVKKYCPALPNMRGSIATDFNSELEKYYIEVKSIGATIGNYSRKNTDCSVRPASFCK